MSPEEILKQYWGYDHFRPLQREIIESILIGKDTLALLPTGGGKSVCYQVPALVKDGLCLVISPLIALMQDQVARLKHVGAAAECIHSGMNYNAVKKIFDNAMHGSYKLLYLSPERLQTRLFRDYIGEFDVSMIAVDEAHCISQWGHDFRPDYLKIATVRDIFPAAPVLALTATATLEVQEDIVKQLKLKEPALFKQSFARDNIFYDVRYSENKNGDMLQNISASCSIVYCRSRKQTEGAARYLHDSGKPAIAYHAGMDKEKRDHAQEQWMENKVPVMVATTAFGMGIDKPNVRMVLHYDAPEHLEAYYQEAGRAGRDGKASTAIALYNSSDIKKLRDSTAIKYPPEAYLRQVYQAVAEYLQLPIGAEPHRYYPFDLADFSQKFSLQATHAIHALKLLEQEGLWTMSEAVYNPSTIQFITDRHTLDDLNHTLPTLGYVAIGLLRMYDAIFHFPVAVKETAIARQLEMKREELIPLLERLHKMEILEYNKPGEGPQLFFHHYRVDSRYLNIDLNRIHILRKRHEARTDAMIDFLENNATCRERLLLTYFGESPKNDCGHCDICRDKYARPINRETIKAGLLLTLQQVESIALTQLLHPYSPSGRTKVIDIVRTLADDGIITLGANGEIKGAAGRKK